MRVQLPWVFLLFLQGACTVWRIWSTRIYSASKNDTIMSNSSSTHWIIWKVFSLFATWLGWALSLVLNWDFIRSNRWGRGSTSMIRRSTLGGKKGRNFHSDVCHFVFLSRCWQLGGDTHLHGVLDEHQWLSLPMSLWAKLCVRPNPPSPIFHNKRVSYKRQM